MKSSNTPNENDPENIADNWEEYTTENGRKYYHNKITKATTWNEPNCILMLKKQSENQPKECNWKEFTTPEGKKYYHNKISNVTQWGMPTEYKLFIEFSKGNKEDEKIDPKKLKEERKVEQREIKPFQLSSDNEENFKRLLKAAGIKPTMNWTDTKSIISSHHCFKSIPLKKMLSIFQLYCEEEKKLEKEQFENHFENCKKNFNEFLKENINEKSKWKENKDKILREEKFSSHLDEEDLHSLFNDHIHQLHLIKWVSFL